MRTLQGHRFGVVRPEWVARLFWAAVWIVVLVFVAPRLVVGAEPPRVWRTDFDAALSEAEEKKLPLLMHFSADWCMPCQQMEQSVFASSLVKEMLATRSVVVKLNFEKNTRLVHFYGVKFLPTDIALDPQTGRVLASHSGPLDQAAYLKWAQQSESRYLAAHPKPVNPDEKLAGSKPDVIVGTVAHLGDPAPLVGLDGYSPVSIMKSRKWTRGSVSFAWDYKGVLYYLSTRDELLEFRKSPESYAPKLLGCDPVVLWETDRAICGSPDFAAFYDGELFLFKTEERRKQFKANPQKFTKLQHALKVDQIDRTAIR